LKVFENRFVRRTFTLKSDETIDWRKPHYEDLRNLLFARYTGNWNDKVKHNEVGKPYGTCMRVSRRESSVAPYSAL
jgi:hypothetical protein